jgi:hypothetical protein
LVKEVTVEPLIETTDPRLKAIRRYILGLLLYWQM